jgi:vacuolar protein sorting-associated protein 53
MAKKQYAEISQTLAAVKQIAVSFKSYTSVHRMSQAWRRIQTIQGELRSMLDKEFDAL